MRLLFTGLLLAATLVGQRRLIVDTLNRPGAQFTDLPPAVAAALPGEVLFLRGAGATTYSATTITRGLTIVGEDSTVAVASPLDVSQVPAGEWLVLDRLQILDLLRVSNCSGGVRLSRLTRPTPIAWVVTGSALVTLDECVLFGPPGLTIDNSTVLFESSRIGGYNALGQNAITATSSTLMLAELQATGGLGTSNTLGGSCRTMVEPGYGIDATNCSVRITRAGATIQGGQMTGCATGYQAGLRMNGGTLTIDPAVTPPVINGLGGYQLVTTPVPALTSVVDAAAALLHVTLRGQPAASSVTFVGLPSLLLATPFGALGLQPALLVVLDSGPLDAAGVRAPVIPLPPNVADALFALQAVLADATGITLSSPSHALIR